MEYISHKLFVLRWMCMARTYARLYLLIVLNSVELWLYVLVPWWWAVLKLRLRKVNRFDVVKSLGILRSVRSFFSSFLPSVPIYLILPLQSTGGSTIVVLFEKGMVQWDEDLLINGRAALETLVRVGSGIGRGRTNVAWPIIYLLWYIYCTRNRLDFTVQLARKRMICGRSAVNTK